MGADALVNERTCKRNAAREMLPLRSAANCCYGESNQFCYGTNYIYLWTLQTAPLPRGKQTAISAAVNEQLTKQETCKQTPATPRIKERQRGNHAAGKQKSTCWQNRKPSLAKQKATPPSNSKPPAGKG